MEEIENLIKEATDKALKCYECGDYISAEEICRQILRVQDNVCALELGSLVLSEHGKSEEAKEWAVKSLSVSQSYQAYNTLGLIHSQSGEHEQAIKCFLKAISKKPDESLLYSNVALEYNKLGDTDQAISVMEKAVKDYPNASLYFNYGAIVHELAMYNKAIGLYKQAIKLDPDFAVAHYNLSACHFLLDDYENGWTEYEWRWKCFPHFAKIRERRSEPYWAGENLRGKTILLYNEQGVGDAIMMCRFVKNLKEMGARVVLETIPPLVDLMSCLDVEISDVTKIDYHCSLLSLPGILKCPIESGKYLHSVGLGRSKAWDNYDGLKVGICWSGSPAHPNDRNRSIPLKHFANLPGTLFGFQKDLWKKCYTDDVEIDFCAGGENVKFINLSEHMTDFNKTANMLEMMDVVVTADTAIAHLAGALGVKVKLALPYLADWRWGLGDKTKWYDNMTLFRRKKFSEWDYVFAVIAHDLGK